jgi:hypothetical protein
MAGTTLAALTLAAMMACTVQKKADANTAGDTTVVAPAQLPPPAATGGVMGTSGSAGAGTGMPDSVTTSASKERTRDAAKTGRKPRGSAAGDSARPTGGERDSATQPMFVIGADGKLHPVKR